MEIRKTQIVIVHCLFVKFDCFVEFLDCKLHIALLEVGKTEIVVNAGFVGINFNRNF